MPQVQLCVGDDYPLNGIITHFEAYMFVTLPKHIAEHRNPIPGELILVDGNRCTVTRAMDNLSVRKASLTNFNQLAKAQIPSIPKPNGLSCCMIDFMPDDESGQDCTEAQYQAVYLELRKAYLDFMATNNRVAAMVQHWAQGHRYPHVHILYQRKRGQHNEFQDWLRSHAGA